MHLLPLVVVEHKVIVEVTGPEVIALDALCTKGTIELDFYPLLQARPMEVMIAARAIVAVDVQTNATLH